MPIPTDERQEEQLNSGQKNNNRLVNNVADTEKNGTFNHTAGSSNDIQDNETSSVPYSGWNNNTDKGTGKKADLSAFLRKKGPLAAILSLFGVGGVSLLFVFSPATLFVHMKEVYADKFNDQLAALDIRSTRVMAKKMTKSTTSGACSTAVTFRCKYQTMSKRQIAKLERAGIKVLDENGNSLTSRGRAAFLEIDGQQFDAAQLQRELRANSAARNAFNRAYNPKVVAFADAIAKKTNNRLKISKRNPFEGVTTKEKATEKLRQSVKGEGVNLQNSPNIVPSSNGDGSFIDTETGEAISEEVVARRQEELDKLDSETKLRSSLANTGERITRSTVKGALTVTALGAGAVDSTCTGYRIIRSVGFAAKYLGMLQLARYGYTFMNTADAIKAGDASPEQVEYLGNILTSTNSQGKSATDSYGYQYAAYNNVSGKPSSLTENEEEARIADETLRYTNGQLVSSSIMAKIIGAVSKSNPSTELADDTCDVVKSGWGQAALIGTAVVGGVVAFFSGGASLGWGVAAQASASLAVGVGVAMVMPKLIDMASGTLVTGDENGNEAGNAITSGMGAYNAQASQSRGLAVLTKEDAIAYQNLTNETIALYNEADKIDANPLDATNRNTFVGSFVSKLIPYVQKNNSVSVKNSIFGSFAAASSVLTKGITTKASTAEEFNYCEDADYAEKKLAADPFCNLRYGLSAAALAIDPDAVLDYMINGGYIDEISGNPAATTQGADLKKYIEKCVDRTDPIGGYTDENDTSDTAKGYECIEGYGDNADRNTMFRLYLIDKSIIDEMEDEVAPTTGTSQGDTDGGLSAGGLTADQGKALMHTYIRDRSGYLSVANLRSYPNECVTFIKYFLAKYVDPKYGSGSLGHGRYVVGNLLQSNAGFINGGNTPKLYAIASYPPGVGAASSSPYGHTAVVIGVNADGSTLVAETGRGFLGNKGTPLYTAVSTVSAAESKQATYAYTDGLLKGIEGLSQ